MFTLECRHKRHVGPNVWYATGHKPLKFLCNAATLVRTLSTFEQDIEYRIAPDYENIEAEKSVVADLFPNDLFKYQMGVAA